MGDKKLELIKDVRPRARARAKANWERQRGRGTCETTPPKDRVIPCWTTKEVVFGIDTPMFDKTPMTATQLTTTKPYDWMARAYWEKQTVQDPTRRWPDVKDRLGFLRYGDLPESEWAKRWQEDHGGKLVPDLRDKRDRLKDKEGRPIRKTLDHEKRLHINKALAQDRDLNDRLTEFKESITCKPPEPHCVKWIIPKEGGGGGDYDYVEIVSQRDLHSAGQYREVALCFKFMVVCLGWFDFPPFSMSMSWSAPSEDRSGLQRSFGDGMHRYACGGCCGKQGHVLPCHVQVNDLHAVLEWAHVSAPATTRSAEFWRFAHYYSALTKARPTEVVAMHETPPVMQQPEHEVPRLSNQDDTRNSAPRGA